MKLENQVVSLELAKQLKELGVRQESLFQWSRSAYNGEYRVTDENFRKWIKIREFHDEPGAMDYYDHVSAFTVAELGEMLPRDLYIPYKGNNGRRRKYPQHPHFFFTSMGCAVNYTGGNSQEHLTQQADTESNSRAKMLAYLLENKLITLEEINKQTKK